MLLVGSSSRRISALRARRTRFEHVPQARAVDIHQCRLRTGSQEQQHRRQRKDDDAGIAHGAASFFDWSLRSRCAGETVERVCQSTLRRRECRA